VMPMKLSNAVLGIMDVSKGGISGTVTDVRILLQASMKANASGIIVCHNHPSCDINTSDDCWEIINNQCYEDTEGMTGDADPGL